MTIKFVIIKEGQLMLARSNFLGGLTKPLVTNIDWLFLLIK